jgi:hypothetical protein
MHILSSSAIVGIADGIARKIIDTYREPDKGFEELREMINSGSAELGPPSIRPL